MFLFGRFGFDKKVIDKILFDLKKLNKRDNRINLVSLKFSVENYKKMTKELRSRLTTTAIDLFHMTNEFAKVHNNKKEVILYLLDDQLQDTNSDTCGFFSTLFLHKNLFTPTLNSQILNEDKLNKQTIEKLFNEIFTLDKQENEQKVEKFAKENEIYRV